MGRKSLAQLRQEAAGRTDWRDGFARFFGQDAKTVSKTRTYQKGDPDKYEPTFGDWVMGRSEEEMRLQAEKKRQDILRTSDDFIELDALDPTSKVDHTTNDATVGLALQDARDLKKVKTEAASVGVPASELVGVKDVGSVQGLTRAQKVQNANDAYKNSPEGERAARTEREETRRYNLEQDRLYRLELETQATRQDQLASDAKDRQQTLRLKQMSMDADKTRYEQERAYYEQDKRSDSIAALVAGLASLGGAFAL